MTGVKDMPADWLLDRFWPSMKQHPAVWFAMCLLAAYGGLRLMQTADATEVEAVKQEISKLQVAQKTQGEKLDTLQKKLIRQSLEQEIRRVASDLYALERDIEKYRDQREQVPELYRKQRSELTERKDLVARRLSEFIAANPELANEPFF